MKELICIVCPKGCKLKIDDKSMNVTGNGCEKGEKYAVSEITNPKRVITSTVQVESDSIKCCPVKTNGAIKKQLIFSSMKLLKGIKLKPPVHIGQVVVKNICGTGIDFIATRNI